MEVPPCRVIAVAHAPEGDRGRLHVVLPTDVKLDIPVCAQAPFIQDPARRGIKELASSPTNRWLLGRIGRLLGSSLLDWLGRKSLNLAERAEAYSFMPPKGTDYSFSVEQSAANYISQAFATEIRGKDVLLNMNGELGSKDGTIALPRQVINVWGWETACEHFAPDWTNALAPHVRPQHVENLSKWGLVEIFKAEDIFIHLQDERHKPLPRPDKIESLLPLWSLAERTVENMTGMWQFWSRAAIVPVQSGEILGRAKDIICLPSAPEKCLDDDWQFLCSKVKLLDSDWSRIMREAAKTEEDVTRLSEYAGMRVDKSDVTRIKNAYDKSGLNRQCELVDILNLAGASVFSIDNPVKEDAIRLVHIAARLDLALKPTDGSRLKFLCQDGVWRTNENSLVPGDIDVWALLPVEWIKTHVIADEYETGLEPKMIDAWRKWAKSANRGGIQQFPLPSKVEKRLWSRNELNEFCRSRGGKETHPYYQSPNYVILDWDFSKDFWDYWEALAVTDSTVWIRVTWAILFSWSKAWDTRKNVTVVERWGGYEREVDTSGARATWLHRLRALQCLPDEFSRPHVPTTLYRRTPETSALEGIEPFLKTTWDLEPYRVGLDALGIRTDPADIKPLLKRLEDFSQAVSPPIGPLRDLYQAVDRVVSRLSDEQIETIKDIFRANKLARAEDTWEHSDAIFRSNPGNLPGVAVLHHDVADIALWERLGIGVEPRLDDALNWVDVLPLESRLSERDRRAAIELLARYPGDVWNKSSRWLNVDGRIVKKDSLNWGCRDSALAEGLFAGIRGSVADFSMVDTNAFISFEELPLLLEDHLELRISQAQRGSETEQSNQTWLRSLGTLLAHLRIPDGSKAEDFTTDRTMGQRLATTRFNPVSSLRVQKYLNNSPVSLEREESVAWHDHTLYVAGDIAGVFDRLVKELARSFRTEESKRAIRDCAARSDAWIEAYGRRHLELDALETEAGDSNTQETNGQGHPGYAEHHGEDSTPINENDTDVKGEDGDGEVGEENVLRRKRQAKQFERLSRYLRERGYQWDESRGVFLHSNGPQVIRTQGIFHWKVVSDGGETPLFLAGSSLKSENGVEIQAESWEMGKLVDAIFLEPIGESYVEHRFHDLAKLVDGGNLQMYSAVVRLKVYDKQS